MAEVIRQEMSEDQKKIVVGICDVMNANRIGTVRQLEVLASMTGEMIRVYNAAGHDGAALFSHLLGIMGAHMTHGLPVQPEQPGVVQ